MALLDGFVLVDGTSRPRSVTSSSSIPMGKNAILERFSVAQVRLCPKFVSKSKFGACVIEGAKQISRNARVEGWGALAKLKLGAFSATIQGHMSTLPNKCYAAALYTHSLMNHSSITFDMIIPLRANLRLQTSTGKPGRLQIWDFFNGYAFHTLNAIPFDARHSSCAMGSENT
jgi:hypothetical protein